jgi:hypothetical protein
MGSAGIVMTKRVVNIMLKKNTNIRVDFVYHPSM